MRASFEQYYLSKVALGEGCGCAEHVTRMREIDAYAATRAHGRVIPDAWRPLHGWLAQLFRKRAAPAPTSDAGTA
jgi:hypothetical protein